MKEMNSSLLQGRFALVWLCVATAFLAQWMLLVATQWFLLQSPDTKSLAPLAQVALTLPIALLAIPAGVVADRLDRRRLVIVVQSGVLAIELVLTVLASTGKLGPWPMLSLLACISCGMALTTMSVNPMVPDLVPTTAIHRASALMAVATNATRFLGPALAGAILAVGSVSVVFAATIPASLLLIVGMLRLGRMPRAVNMSESWVSAARGGVRYVRHSPQALKLLTRSFVFGVGIMGLISLLPLLAARHGSSAAELGLVLASQGLGAVLGALTLPRLGRVLRSNQVVSVGMAVAALGLLAAEGAPSVAWLSSATVVAGWAWTTALVTVQAEMQLYLPGWVRGRGLSILMFALFAGQAVGAIVFGGLAAMLSLEWALKCAAGLLLAAVLLAYVLPLRDLSHVDRSAAPGWPDAQLGLMWLDSSRRVQVRTRYEVPPECMREFLELMAKIRVIRQRTGALRWQLLEDAQLSDVLHEQYMMDSWDQRKQQLEVRGTASDRCVEMRLRQFTRVEPSTQYSLRLGLSRSG